MLNIKNVLFSFAIPLNASPLNDLINGNEM